MNGNPNTRGPIKPITNARGPINPQPTKRLTNHLAAQNQAERNQAARNQAARNQAARNQLTPFHNSALATAKKSNPLNSQFLKNAKHRANTARIKLTQKAANRANRNIRHNAAGAA